MNSSVPKKGINDTVNTNNLLISQRLFDFSFSFFFLPFPKILMSCWTVGSLEKMGSSTIHSEFINGVQNFQSFCLRLSNFFLPATAVCQPVVLWGFTWEHRKRRSPSCWTESRVVSLPNQISDREIKLPRLWWEFFPDPCGRQILFHSRNANSTFAKVSLSVVSEFSSLAGLRSLVTSNLQLAEDQP